MERIQGFQVDDDDDELDLKGTPKGISYETKTCDDDGPGCGTPRGFRGLASGIASSFTQGVAFQTRDAARKPPVRPSGLQPLLERRRALPPGQ
eukprot:3879171-Pyramimonas_sp.AAC.1